MDNKLIVATIIDDLKLLSSEAVKNKQAHFGINNSLALGVSMPNVRLVAKGIKKDSGLANALWATKIHEARIAASLIANPKDFTEKYFLKWIDDFNSWDVCDQCCSNLFVKLPYCQNYITNLAASDKEFTRRAAFALIAYIAVHQKKLPDSELVQYFTLIEQYAFDDRNFVKKAVNWALRQLGKRSAYLKKHALKMCDNLLEQPFKSAHWIARDALRELEK